MPGGTLSSELFGHKPNSELSDVKLRSPQSPATAVTIAAKHDMYGRSRYRSLHLLRTRYCTTYYRTVLRSGSGSPTNAVQSGNRSTKVFNCRTAAVPSLGAS